MMGSTLDHYQVARLTSSGAMLMSQLASIQNHFIVTPGATITIQFQSNSGPIEAIAAPAIIDHLVHTNSTLTNNITMSTYLPL